jgi:hypothetical protein
VLKKASRNKDVDDIPDVRADEPERAMEQFTDGLRRVLAAPKTGKRAQSHPRRHRTKRKSTR